LSFGPQLERRGASLINPAEPHFNRIRVHKSALIR
jgi:hypothetical protein